MRSQWASTSSVEENRKTLGRFPVLRFKGCNVF
jgi:hypothetical protein